MPGLGMSPRRRSEQAPPASIRTGWLAASPRSTPPNKPLPPTPRTASGAPKKPLPPTPRTASGAPNKPLPPIPARKPTWTSANRQEGPRGSTLEIGHNRVSLSGEERSRLAVAKQSLVGRKAREMNLHPGDWSLTTQQRENPEDEKGGGAKSILEAIYDQGLSGVAAPILDSASSVIDFAGGGKDRNFKSVGRGSKSTWGDGSLQSNGVGIPSAVIKAKDIVVNTGRYVKQLVQFVKDSKDERALETGSSGLAHGEKRAMILKTVDLLKTYLDSALSIMGTFTTLAGILPIVGAVLGAISAGLSFAVNIAQLCRSNKALESVRAQKAEAKSHLQGEATAFGPQMTLGHMEDRTTGSGSETTTIQKFKVNMVQGRTVDQETQKLRDMRLDEKLARLHNADRAGVGAAFTPSQKGALRHAEDYVVTKELAKANENRRREAITNMIFQDATGFLAAIMCLDPTGMGAAVGSGINAIVGAAYGVKNVIKFFRQKARNHGIGGADLNKSDANKRRHRHNLAIMMYDRIKDLADTTVTSIDNPDQVTPQQRAAVSDGTLDELDVLNERVEAMQVGGPFLRSHSAPELVSVMRNGFYRDSDE